MVVPPPTPTTTPPVVPPTPTTTPPVVPPVTPPTTGGGNSGGGGGGGGGGSSGGSSGPVNNPPPNVIGTGPITIGAPKAGGALGGTNNGITLTRVLTLGSTGADVKLLQQYLNNNGFKIAATGTGSPGKESTYFGPATVAALKKFQCAKAIVCAGTAATNGYGATGPKTRAALKGSGGMQVTTIPVITGQFTRTLTMGSIGPDVKSLQVFLNSNGFRIATSGIGSPGKESTYFGPATKAAVIRFQQANQITPASGVFGPLTRAKVNSMR